MSYIKASSNKDLPLDTQLILVYKRTGVFGDVVKEYHIGDCYLDNNGKGRTVIAGGRFEYDLGELCAYKVLETFDEGETHNE